MDTKKKIIIVEDNDLYRAALKDLINAQEHLEVVAEAGSGGEALKIIKQFPADLVLLDLRLPGRSGYDVFPEISKSTDAKILVLTILESDHNIRAAFDAGADGYCFKDVSSQELLDAISSVLAGVRYVSRPALSYPEERRAEHRQACDYNIVWAYFNKDNLVSARMLNCSRGGCYFETPQHVTTGSTVSIRLERSVTGPQNNAAGPVRSNVVAEVKWCDNRNNQYGVGARYHFQG
jgi:two-component system nitrate/nitrite response regulator NarP